MSGEDSVKDADFSTLDARCGERVFSSPQEASDWLLRERQIRDDTLAASMRERYSLKNNIRRVAGLKEVVSSELDAAFEEWAKDTSCREITRAHIIQNETPGLGSGSPTYTCALEFRTPVFGVGVVQIGSEELDKRGYNILMEMMVRYQAEQNAVDITMKINPIQLGLVDSTTGLSMINEERETGIEKDLETYGAFSEAYQWLTNNICLKLKQYCEENDLSARVKIINQSGEKILGNQTTNVVSSTPLVDVGEPGQGQESVPNYLPLAGSGAPTQPAEEAGK